MHLYVSALLVLWLGFNHASAALAELGPDGKLRYHSQALPGSDADRGDILPDFSWCGYKSNMEPIPKAAVVLRISPQPGDNREAIQAAIDLVSKMPMDAGGLRGALFLNAGEYRIGGTLQVKASGVILRGAGAGAEGTRLIATQKSKHTLILFSGAGGSSETGTRSRIVDPYVAIGAKTFHAEGGHGLKPGDAVIVRRAPNAAWIDVLGMSKYGWSAGSYVLAYKRKVLEVAGDAVTIDAPIVDPIDPKFAEGTVSRYVWPGKIENCGIEDMRLVSEYQGEADENHGWDAVGFDQIQDSWMLRVEAHFFGYSTVNVLNGGYRISILDCKNVDPKSQTTGGRKYSFNVSGQLVLVMGCQSRNGRHDFVTASRVPGPNAFVRCSAELQKNDMGPHHRWSTGVLFDNVTGDAGLNVQNRAASGSGHGWAGAQCLFWNCRVKDMVVQSPPGHVNWSIGSLANITGKGGWFTAEAAYVESAGHPVSPASIFDQQLSDRGQASNNPGSTSIGIRPYSRTGGNVAAIRPLGGGRWNLSLPSDGVYGVAALDPAGRMTTVRNPAWERGGSRVIFLQRLHPMAGLRLVVLDEHGRPEAGTGWLRGYGE